MFQGKACGLAAKGNLRTFIRRNRAKISGSSEDGPTMDTAIENFLARHLAEFPPKGAVSERELTYAIRTRDLVHRQSTTMIAFKQFTAGDFFCLLW